ncbi:hypothetical protein [Actinomadura bangladeshensis]|uniref:hypothetical protein n=1 Tax=Actinomadura bangladeshensis TaxID=453573 RepID=UPI0031D2445C
MEHQRQLINGRLLVEHWDEILPGTSSPSPVGTALSPASACRLMDRFQFRLVCIALDVVGDRGFVLGGGHAVQMHGMGARPSEDIDLFSSQRGSPERPPTASSPPMQARGCDPKWPGAPRTSSR